MKSAWGWLAPDVALPRQGRKSRVGVGSGLATPEAQAKKILDSVPGLM